MPRLPVVLLALLCACGEQPAAPAPTAAPASGGASTVTATGVPEHPAATGATELNVFAAASLTEAFGEIGRAFEGANPGVRVVFNFGGSQQLAQQIGQGAPADVFAPCSNCQYCRWKSSSRSMSAWVA
ncbi:MAG: hypothetical protein OHK0022_08290 [Roseiflexaceae bacterium]